MNILPQLDQLGAKLVALGPGTHNFAKKFKEGLSFPGEVYRDPDAKVYEALNLPQDSTLWVCWYQVVFQ